MLMELAQKLKERRSQHYQEMLQIQKEQEQKQKEEQEKNKKMIQDKENEIKEDIQRAQNNTVEDPGPQEILAQNNNSQAN